MYVHIIYYICMYTKKVYTYIYICNIYIYKYIIVLVVCVCVFVFMCGVVLKPVVLQSVDQAPKGQKGLAGQLSQRWAVS